MTTSPSQSYDTQNALESLQRMVNAEFEISAYDPVTDEQFSWSPSDDELPRWIDISLESDGFVVDLRPDQMREFVEGINADLGDGRALESDRVVTNLVAQITGAPQPVEPLIIEYLPSSYVVQPGDNLVSISFKIGLPYWKLYETNPQLASRGLVVGEELVVPPKDDMLSLPVIPEKRIVISLLEQTMWVYEDRELLFEHVVSTGIPNSPTLPGIFQINSHVENAYASIWDLSMPHFLGIYDAVPGLTNGIHGLPLLSSGRRLWADVLGNPASYGCIILDLDAAEHLFYWAEEGVVVEIRE
jgi:LysM repeat protein